MPKDLSHGFSGRLKKAFGKGKRSGQDELVENQRRVVPQSWEIKGGGDQTSTPVLPVRSLSNARAAVQEHTSVTPSNEASASYPAVSGGSQPSCSVPSAHQAQHKGQTDNPTKHRYGLIHLWEGKRNESSIDVVAVHGLNGHPFDTWTDKKSGKLWLRDFLPQATPTARIFSFGYNADVYSSRSDNDILSCAKNLLAALSAYRSDGAEYRPLVLIGHSMGGLIIKTALLEAKERDDPVWLAAREGGIMFMAVPHGGSTLAEFTENLSNIAKVAAPTNDRMLKELVTNCNDLLTLSRRFSNVQRELRFASVLESERTPLSMAGRGSVKVVDDKSARLNLGEPEYKIDGADHRTVCKFSDITDPQYLQIQHTLQTLARPAGTAAPLPEYFFDFLKDVCDRDPYYDMIRIKDMKGGLLESCYQWVLDDAELRDWQHEDGQLLWIKGQPGKGKTMLMIGLVETMTASITQRGDRPLSYFFCEQADPKLNNGLYVLRGLIWKLLHRNRFLHDHIPQEYRSKGKEKGQEIFIGRNAFYILTSMLSNMLRDSRLEMVNILIDALDECDKDLMGRLLNWIVQEVSSGQSRAKWILSSRYDSWIAEILGCEGLAHKLILEMNDSHVTKGVQQFIKSRVDELAVRKSYDLDLRKQVEDILMEKSESTFLWVALVCQRLHDVSRRCVMSELEEMPSGLEGLYLRMLDRIEQAHDKEKELCRNILLATTAALRPLTLEELQPLADLWKHKLTPKDVRELVELCGSFLILRDDTVYFVHLSAREFLERKLPKNHWLALSDHGKMHSTIALRSIQAMSVALREDIFDLKCPGCLISEIEEPDPNPLEAIQYPCIYWVDHVCEMMDYCGMDRNLEDRMERFLEERFLHWLEALTLIGKFSAAIIALQKLLTIFSPNTESQNLHLLIRDAKDFALYHRPTIELAPLQIYSSAIIFTPSRNHVRKLGSGSIPAWIQRPPQIPEWGTLQILGGHAGSVYCLQYSHDGQRLAFSTFGRDFGVRLWTTDTGECEQTFSYLARQLAFSHDDIHLAGTDASQSVRVWNVVTGELEHTLDISDFNVPDTQGEFVPIGDLFLAFSPNAQLFVATSQQTQIWDTCTGARTGIVHAHPLTIFPEHDSPQISAFHIESMGLNHKLALKQAAVDAGGKICAWHPSFYEWCFPQSTACSVDGRIVVKTDDEGGYGIYDAMNGKLKHDLRQWISGKHVRTSTMSQDSRVLATACRIKIFIFDLETGMQTNVLQHPSAWLVAFCPDGRRLASATYLVVEGVQISNIAHFASTPQRSPDPRNYFLRLSSDQRLLYSLAFARPAVVVTDLETNEETCATLLDEEFENNIESTFAKLKDTHLETVFETDNEVRYKVWDITTGKCLFERELEDTKVDQIVSRDGKLSAVRSNEAVQILSLSSQPPRKILELRTSGSNILAIAFSHHGQRITVRYEHTVQLWCIHTATLELEFTLNKLPTESVFFGTAFSPSGRRLALLSKKEIWIIDTKTEMVQQILNAEKVGWGRFEFGEDDYSLMTANGCLKLSGESNATDLQPSPQEPIWIGLGINREERTWITWNGIRILAIPTEYQPKSFRNAIVIEKETIVLRDSRKGFVYSIKFNGDLIFS